MTEQYGRGCTRYAARLTALRYLSNRGYPDGTWLNRSDDNCPRESSSLMILGTAMQPVYHILVSEFKQRTKGSPGNGPSLPRVLHFLDVHSGSMQAIAAIILVIVTIIYTILTRMMAKAAREALSPYVYLDFAFPSGSGVDMLLTVGNSGSKAAAAVEVTLINSTREDLEELFAPLPLAAIGHLSPGATRKYSLMVRSTLWPENQESPVLDFQIVYRDGRHRITEKQRIDFAGYLLSVPQNNASLSKMASTLESISRNMPTKKAASPFSGKKCPYCASRIDTSAKKCPICHEWISNRGRLRTRYGAQPAKVRRPSLSPAWFRRRNVSS